MTCEDSLINLGNEIKKKQKFDFGSSEDGDIVINCINEYRTQTLSDIDSYQIGIRTFYHGLQYLYKIFKNAELENDSKEDIATGTFKKGCYNKRLFCVRFELAGQAFHVCLDAYISEAEDEKNDFSEIVCVTAVAKEYDSFVIESVLSVKEKKMMETMLSSIPGLENWAFDLQSSQLFYGKMLHRYTGVYVFFLVLITLQKIQNRYFQRIYLDHIRQKLIDDDILGI